MNSDRSSLNYQRFTPSDCQGIRKLEFLVMTQLLND